MAKFDSWDTSYKRGILFKILGKKWPSSTAGTLHKQSKSYIKIVCTSLICVQMTYERTNSKLEFSRQKNYPTGSRPPAILPYSMTRFLSTKKNTGHF